MAAPAVVAPPAVASPAVAPVGAGASPVYTIVDVTREYNNIQKKMIDIEPSVTDKLRVDYIRVKLKVTAFNNNFPIPAGPVAPGIVNELKGLMRDVVDIERKVNMFNIGKKTEERANEVAGSKEGNVKSRPETAFDRHAEFSLRSGGDVTNYENVKKILESGILRSSKKRSPVIYVR